MEGWGLRNVSLGKWGLFGQGWSRKYFSACLTEPQYEQLIGVPLGWSLSTDRKLEGRPMVAPIKRDGRLYRDEQTGDE